ncbi:MAG: hypothetical protein R2867_22940 [Caldilineaceae bacterium]
MNNHSLIQRRPQRQPQRRSQQQPPQSAPQMLPPTTADAPQQSPTQNGKQLRNATPSIHRYWPFGWQNAAQSSNGARATRLLLTATGVTVQAAPLTRPLASAARALGVCPQSVAMLRRQRQTRVCCWAVATLDHPDPCPAISFRRAGRQVTPSWRRGPANE